jgi:hypothetical protein
MNHLAAQLFVLGVTALVAFAPGGVIVWATGLSRALPAYLLLPAALTCGVLPLSLATAITLWMGVPIWWTVALDLLLVAGIAEAAHRLKLREDAHHVAKRLHEEPVQRWFLWTGDLPGALWAIVLVAGVIGFIVGGGLDNDTLYHAAQALKLATLDDPSFGNTLQFIDGGPHPGYLLPAWHETIAIASKVSGSEPATVLWVLPALTLPVGVLAFAGLAFVLFRSHAAAVLGGLAYLMTDVVMSAPRMIPLQNGGQPRIVVWSIVIPLALACMIMSLWHGKAPSRARTRGMLIAATVAVLIVHVSYILFLGFAAIGYLGVWLLQAPWQPGSVRSHVRTMLALGATAVIGLAVLMPILNDLDSFTKGGSSGATSAQRILDAGAKLDQPALAKVGVLFVGSKEHYHLRPDRLVRFGGLALLALLLLPVTLLVRRREPFSWLLAGTGLAVLAVSQSDRLFPALTDAASPAQSQRLDQALPLEMGLTFGAVVLAAIFSWFWKREDYHWRGGSVILAIVAAGGVNRVTDANPMIDLTHQSIPSWPIQLAIGALALVVLYLAIAALLRLGRWRGIALPPSVFQRLPRLERVTDPSLAPLDMGLPPFSIVPGGMALAALVLIVGSWSAVGVAKDAVQDAASKRPSSVLKEDELALIPNGVVRKARALKPGSVVLADPLTSYRVMAIAPVYVVSSVPGHTANTVKNRIAERFADVQTYYAKRTSDARRAAIRTTDHVDAVLVAAPKRSIPKRR